MRTRREYLEDFKKWFKFDPMELNDKDLHDCGFSDHESLIKDWVDRMVPWDEDGKITAGDQLFLESFEVQSFEEMEERFFNSPEGIMDFMEVNHRRNRSMDIDDMVQIGSIEPTANGSITRIEGYNEHYDRLDREKMDEKVDAVSGDDFDF